VLEVANEHQNDFDYQLDLGNDTLELVREQSRPLDAHEVSNCVGWVTNWLRSDKRKFNFSAAARQLINARLNNTREMLISEKTPQTPISKKPSSLPLADDNVNDDAYISPSEFDFDAVLGQIELPPEWIRVPPGFNTDLTPRPAYFYHRETREVRWINPEANDIAVPPPPPPPQQPPPPPQQTPPEL